MSADSIDLDGHRSDADQRATEIRRRLAEVRHDQSRLEQRQKEFETFFLAGPAHDWPEVAAKAQYFIQLLIDTYSVRDPRHLELMAHVFNDFAKLSADDSATVK